jgi:ankyrin repeat protein
LTLTTVGLAVVPLHVAALVDRIDLVRRLLDHGADRALVTNDGRDAHMIAIQGESPRVGDRLAG